MRDARKKDSRKNDSRKNAEWQFCDKSPDIVNTSKKTNTFRTGRIE